MESVVRFLDGADDLMMSAWFSIRRWLGWKPRERRRADRTSDKLPENRTSESEISAEESAKWDSRYPK